MKTAASTQPVEAWSGDIRLTSGMVQLAGSLDLPANAHGLVIFAHGSGSSRLSPRNRRVAQRFQQAGLGTLLFDLLTRAEEAADALSGHLRFDIELLAARLRVAADWATRQPRTAGLPIGYFGASTGAAAALVAAAEMPGVAAVVSRGGRPDLAREALPRVKAPTLLIVGGDDEAVLPLNELAFEKLRCPKRLEIVPGASHLFEEPGTLDVVARLATDWFTAHLANDHS